MHTTIRVGRSAGGSRVGAGRADPVRWFAQGLLVAYLAPAFLLVLIVGGAILVASGVAGAVLRLADVAPGGPIAPALDANRPARR